MPTICPKCHTVRPATTVVPDWQRPAYRVAYTKAGGDGSSLLAGRRLSMVNASNRSDS